MMIGCIRRRGLPSAAGLLLIAGLVIAQNLQAAALRACPHHGGAEHSVVDGPADAGAGTHHGAPAPEAPHPGHVPSHDSDTDSHDGPCDCLGPCSASAAVHAPASPAESVSAEAAPRRVAVPEAADRGAPRLARPFVLPYPNAPPA